MNRNGELIAGRFELYDLLGQGGMGSVWRSYDRKNADIVAAKLLTHTDAAMLLRFVREQSLRVHHPHVAAPSGWAADDDHVVLRMELLRGGSLATLIGDNGPLPDDYVAVLLDQVLDGLSAVHAVGVVHRDVKPANLLLEVTGRGRPSLRLSDFGIAAVVDEPRLTHASVSIGTLGYMAPEQAAGADPDPRQDLYAVGVLGRVLLTASPPRLLPDTIDSRLWSWLQRLSSPEAMDRPTSAKAARRELQHLGVPSKAPWNDSDDAPEVFDQLGPDPLRRSDSDSSAPAVLRGGASSGPSSQLPGVPRSGNRTSTPLSDPETTTPRDRALELPTNHRRVRRQLSRQFVLRATAVISFAAMVVLLVTAAVVWFG